MKKIMGRRLFAVTAVALLTVGAFGVGTSSAATHTNTPIARHTYITHYSVIYTGKHGPKGLLKRETVSTRNYGLHYPFAYKTHTASEQLYANTTMTYNWFGTHNPKAVRFG